MSYDHNQIPLIQKSYDLYKIIYRAVKLFPKADKYNLGHELKALNMQILGLLIEAECTRKEWKLTALEKTSNKVSLLKIFVRLANDLKIIEPKQYLSLQKQLQEIGRMLGSWIKAVN